MLLPNKKPRAIALGYVFVNASCGFYAKMKVRSAQ